MSCPQDADFFIVNLATGQSLGLTLQFDGTLGDLGLFLHGPTGATVASSETAGGSSEQLSHTALAAGPHYVDVRGVSPTTRTNYELRVQLGTPPVSTCQDDAYEDDDSIQTARVVAPGTIAGQVCLADPDFYRLDLNAGDRLAVEMTYTHSAGDLDVEVYGPNGLVVASSAASSGLESASHVATASGPHVVRVFGRGEAEGAYSLVITVTPAGQTCRDDGFEDNDTTATASAVAPGTHNATLCPGDEDFFALNVNAGDTLDVTLTLAGGVPDLSVTVSNPNGTALGSGTSPGSDTLHLTAVASGRHVVRVFPAAGVTLTDAVAYQLAVAVTPVTSSCTDDGLEDNDTAATARSLAVGTHQAKICAGDDDFYRVTLGTGDRLTAQIAFDNQEADLDLYLLDAAGTVVESSTGVGSTESVSHTALASGAYVVRVVGYGGAEGPYTLTLAVVPATSTCHEDAYEENDTAAAARTVQPGTLDGQLCRGDDDFYGVALNAGDTLTATVTFAQPAGGTLVLVLLAPGGAALDESTGASGAAEVSTVATAAGTHVVRVYGTNGAEAAYALGIQVQPAVVACTDDSFEENDSAATGTPVGPGTFSGVICPGDLDFFRVTVNAQDTIKLDLTFTHANGDLDLALLSPSEQVVAQSTGVTGTESITHTATVAGTYAVKVYGFRTAQNSYSLQVRVDPYVPACTDDNQEENDSAAAARTIAPGVVGSLRMCGLDDDWFAMDVVAGDTVQVVLTTSTPNQNVDVQLQNAAGTVLASGTGPTGSETVNWVAVASGRVLVRVFAAAGVAADYALNVTVTPAAPTCTDDALEPNDTRTSPALVTAQTYANLMACANDDDFYAVDVPAQGTLTVTITFTHASGDLELVLLDAAGTTLASSTGVTGTETVSATVQTASRLTARVFGYGGAQNSYAMTVQVTGGTPSCTDDAMEENDTLATATPVGVGSRQGKICAGDPDYFKVTLGAGETLEATLRFTHSSGDLDLKLLDAQGAVVSSSTGGSDTERVTTTATTGGTYHLHVYGFLSATNTYTLEVAITPPLTCQDDNQEPNNSAAAARALPTAATNLKICPSDDDWFKADLTAGEVIDVTITFTHASGDLDLRLLDADGSTVLAQSLGSTGVEEVVYQTPTTKTVYVKVSGVSGASNAYTMTPTRSLPAFTCPADDPLEPNNNRETATVLGRGQVRVGQVCNANDDWFAVALRKGEAVTLDLTLTNGTGDLDLRLYGPTGTGSALASSLNLAGAAEQVTYTATVPGTFFAKVSGWNGAQNRYALTMKATGAPATCQEDALEENDTMAQADANENAYLDFRADTNAGQVCANDVDLFYAYVFSTEDLVLDLKYDHGLGDLDLAVLKEDGTQVASSVGVSGTEHIVYSPTASAYYYVKVHGFLGASGAYTLISYIRDRP
jgi:hypothetical protein